MDDLKSASELAMEKVAKLGEATDEERLRWRYLPEGEKLAQRYLNGDSNLAAELAGYEEKAKKYLLNGIHGVMLGSIGLPRSGLAQRNNKRAMDGLKLIKKDKIAVENVFSKMRQLFNHYVDYGEQQGKQAYEQLKAEFEARLQQVAQEQLGSPMAGINVEKHPQFQDEWRRLLAQMELQYISHLDEYKKELEGID